MIPHQRMWWTGPRWIWSSVNWCPLAGAAACAPRAVSWGHLSENLAWLLAFALHVLTTTLLFKLVNSLGQVPALTLTGSGAAAAVGAGDGHWAWNDMVYDWAEFLP